MASPPILTRDTLIPVGAVVLVLSAAFSYGIMYNKVETLSSEMVGMRSDIKELTAVVLRFEGTKSLSYVRP